MRSSSSSSSQRTTRAITSVSFRNVQGSQIACSGTALDCAIKATCGTFRAIQVSHCPPSADVYCPSHTLVQPACTTQIFLPGSDLLGPPSKLAQRRPISGGHCCLPQLTRRLSRLRSSFSAELQVGVLRATPTEQSLHRPVHPQTFRTGIGWQWLR